MYYAKNVIKVPVQNANNLVMERFHALKIKWTNMENGATKVTYTDVLNANVKSKKMEAVLI